MKAQATEKLQLVLQYLKYAKKLIIAVIGITTAIIAALEGEGELAGIIGAVTSLGVFQATNGNKPKRK